MTNANPSRLVPLLVVVATGALTAVSVVVTRFALGAIPPLILSALRLGIGALALAAAAAVLRRPFPAEPALWGKLLAAGVITVGIPVIGYTIALTTMSSGVSSVFTSLVPLVAAIIAWAWLGEGLSRAGVGGLALALGGGLLLVLTGASGLAEGSGSPLLGYAISTLAVISGAGGAVFTRRYLGAVDPVAVSAGQMAAGALASLPFAAMEIGGFSPQAVPAASWWATLASALTGTGLGYLLFVLAIQRYGGALILGGVWLASR